MKTITTTQKIYLHARSYDKEDITINFGDMTQYGDILIATKDIELSFDVPEDYDVVQLEVDQLKNALSIVKAESYVKEQNIEEQIQRLLAIGNDGGDE